MLRTYVTDGNTYNEMNWVAQIKNILDDSRLSEIWLYQYTISINFDVIKYHILDIHKNQINTQEYVTRIDCIYIFCIKIHFYENVP